MSEHTERAGANPAETEPARMPIDTDRLVGDLSEIHGLLRKAVNFANTPNLDIATSMDVMDTTARLFKATCGAYQLLARLRDEIPETRHRTVIEHVGDRPAATQASLHRAGLRRAAGAPSPEDFDKARQKLRELNALNETSRGTPSENLKTTSGPRVRCPS
ncbi:MAG: hypothetical protein KGJ79_17275 [Alphaproteobacteria bacterium]|nr:hypothetical protein [Alphaproteobacteria bacterium]MDE2112892.1 hypothetical protein [Alphaproteobacteria bacterium]MDE2495300.1 hypothetical protein [Alphaproteobacteria bacterium]